MEGKRKKERKISAKITKKNTLPKRETDDKNKDKIKIKEIPISNISKTFSVFLKISKANILKEALHIPDFLMSILSLGKIHIGNINISSSKVENRKYFFKISFFPSLVLQLLSKHKQMSYSAYVFYDKQEGYLTEKTLFIEEKTDGRKYEKSEDFEMEKDPVSIILDFMGAENRENIIDLQQDDIDLPFEINSSENKIEVLPKTDEAKSIFSSLRIDFEKEGEIKFPSSVSLEGLFSIFSIVIEKVTT